MWIRHTVFSRVPFFLCFKYKMKILFCCFCTFVCRVETIVCSKCLGSKGVHILLISACFFLGGGEDVNRGKRKRDNVENVENVKGNGGPEVQLKM